MLTSRSAGAAAVATASFPIIATANAFALSEEVRCRRNYTRPVLAQSDRSQRLRRLRRSTKYRSDASDACKCAHTLDHRSLFSFFQQLFLGVLRPPPSAPPPQSPKLLAQYLVRAVLGLASWLSIRRLAFAVRGRHLFQALHHSALTNPFLTFVPPLFRRCSAPVSPQVRERLGPRTATYFALLTAVQFHVPFYASRFLPNTFALILCNVASAEWILGKRPGLVVYLMAFTVTVVRCDTALLAAPVRAGRLIHNEACCTLVNWRFYLRFSDS